MLDAVLDANVLIDFAEANAIGTLQALLGARALVTPQVHIELSRGVAVGKPDPCLYDGKLWVTKTPLDAMNWLLRMISFYFLASITMEKLRALPWRFARAHYFVSRDDQAVKIAKARRVVTLSTIGLLQFATQCGLIAADSAREIAVAMAHRGVDPTPL